jgi:AdoMet-dependent heme synthase
MMKKNPAIPIARSECPDERWKGKGVQHIFFELTPACNNRCPGCLNESFIADFPKRALKAHYHGPPLNKHDWLSLLLRLPETLRLVTLSGGEPTLHPEFMDILQELESRRLEFVIFTNGRWPDPLGLIAWLKNSLYFKGFLISLHGASAATHEAFSGLESSFEETVGNIRLAASAGLPITLSAVITRQNLSELVLMPSLALELGAEELSFNRYLYSPERVRTGGESITPPLPHQLQEAVRQIEYLRRKYEAQIRIGYGPAIPQCFEDSVSQGCSAGDASLVIDPWGNVKPCLHVNLTCGNLLRDDFETIWSSESLRMWRSLGDETCSKCSALSVCGGGCKAMTLSWGKKRDPLMTVPLDNQVIELEMITS